MQLYLNYDKGLDLATCCIILSIFIDNIPVVVSYILFFCLQFDKSLLLCSSFTKFPFSSEYYINFLLCFSTGKGKRWKNLYFILEGNDAQLIYFESEKRATKPKGLIDLSVCSVYGVHDSLFGRWDAGFWFLYVQQN